jgi:hypothetical protein
LTDVAVGPSALTDVVVGVGVGGVKVATTGVGNGVRTTTSPCPCPCPFPAWGYSPRLTLDDAVGAATDDVPGQTVVVCVTTTEVW